MSRFEAWETYNLARFAKEAYARIQELETELNDMKTSHAPRLRELLRQTPDGLTVVQASDALDLPHTSTRRALKTMPDAYIDRWEGPHLGKWSAVWCVVVPPANCPRPDHA
jgi:hypothetical protein